MEGCSNSSQPQVDEWLPVTGDGIIKKRQGMSDDIIIVTSLIA